MSDLPILVKSPRESFPYQARLNSPYGALNRGPIRLVNGVSLKVVARLSGGGLLTMAAQGTWLEVPEHWLEREALVRPEKTS